MITNTNYNYYNYMTHSSGTKATESSNIRFNKLIPLGNDSTNNIVNTAFDLSFKKNDATSLINQVNKLLPGIHNNKSYNLTNVNLKTNYLMYGLPQSANISDGNTTVTTTKDGHIQISNGNLKDILVNNNDLNAEEWQGTEVKRSIYNYLPGMSDLPIPSYVPIPGRTDISNKEIISGGVRFLDPWPQSSWEQTSWGKSWPPDPFTTRGPVKLSSDNYNQAILLDTNHPSCLNVGKSYGVIPRGIIAVNPTDSSIIMAIQQENTNSGVLLPLAPWVIAPIKVPKDKKALAVFPIQKDISEVLTNSSCNNVPEWLKTIKSNQKWRLNNSKEFLIIDPEAPGNQSKLYTPNTNWALYAIEGSDKVILMRSLYKHPDQFQAFVRKPEKSNKAEYLELEYTGPMVPPGEKSTVVVKWDFIPVSLLSRGSFSQFGQTGNMEEEVTTISKLLKEMIRTTTD